MTRAARATKRVRLQTAFRLVDKRYVDKMYKGDWDECMG
jgi:hypothetical protein